VVLTTLLLSSTEGLMGLMEDQPSSPSFKGLDVMDESPPSNGGVLAPPTAPQM